MTQDDRQGGIYFERKIYLSNAFLALGKNARMVLLAMLDARRRNPAYKPKEKKGHRSHRFIDLDKITMPYMKLNDDFGIPIPSIPRAIDELLAKGFIEIKHAGGAGEHDKAVYALIEDYSRWKHGIVFRVRDRDVKRGFQGKGLGATSKQNSHAKC